MIICKCDACGAEFRNAITIDCEPSLYDEFDKGRARLFSDVPFVKLFKNDAGQIHLKVVSKDICTNCIQSLGNIEGLQEDKDNGNQQ